MTFTLEHLPYEFFVLLYYMNKQASMQASTSIHAIVTKCAASEETRRLTI